MILLVSVAALRPSLIYSRCSSQEIEGIDDLNIDGSHPRASGVSSEVCWNLLNDIILFFTCGISILFLLVVVIGISHWFRILDWRVLLGCGKPGMFTDGIARVLDHPGDVDTEVVSIEADPVPEQPRGVEGELLEGSS
jgi:hypothetical protein